MDPKAIEIRYRVRERFTKRSFLWWRDDLSIAERNQEINRRRLQKRDAGPLRVRDPAALARLWGELRAQERQHKSREDQREKDRAAREGDRYKIASERQQEAHLAKREFQAGEEGKIVQGRFDPYKKYYQLLDVDRSASTDEIKRAYKKVALAYHPDKQRSATEEQQEAIQMKFQEIREAFDVLIDEELRAVYDRVRDYMEVHGERAIPSLTLHEAGLMRQGMGELSRLRRQGLKLKKHDPTLIEVPISMRKLNFGCTKTVNVIRMRVDDRGLAIECPKNFHLIIRKGTADGTRIPFEREGDETVDTHPGDLIFVLKQKSHSHFKRFGKNNLEMCCPAAEKGLVWYFQCVKSVYGRSHVVQFSPIMESLKSGGCGGVWEAVFPGAGLYDTDDPWDNEVGSLHVKVRYPPVTALEACFHFAPLLMIGSQDDSVGGSIAGCFIADLLKQEQRCMDRRPTHKPIVVCLHCGVSPTAVATVDALTFLVSTAVPYWMHIALPCSCLLLDDESEILKQAEVIVLDIQPPPLLPLAALRHWRSHLNQRMHEEGLWDILFERRLSGKCIVALDASCSFMGINPQQGDDTAMYPTFMPYIVRSGGGDDGWLDLYTSAKLIADPDRKDVEGVGIIKEATLLIDGITHEAETLVSPTREMIAATAQKNMSYGYSPSYRFHEDFEDKGYSEHCIKSCFESTASV